MWFTPWVSPIAYLLLFFISTKCLRISDLHFTLTNRIETTLCNRRRIILFFLSFICIFPHYPSNSKLKTKVRTKERKTPQKLSKNKRTLTYAFYIFSLISKFRKKKLALHYNSGKLLTHNYTIVYVYPHPPYPSLLFFRFIYLREKREK